MRNYLKAMGKHLGSAAADVLFVSAISLAPLLFGRLVLVLGDPAQQSAEPYWSFLWNGQLAFYSMSSLAAILLTCFRKKLPEQASLPIGLLAVLVLVFLGVLVGIDPSLNTASFSFVGWAALGLYLGVQLTRILVDAMKQVSAADALSAGERANDPIRAGLGARKGVS